MGSLCWLFNLSPNTVPSVFFFNLANKKKYNTMLLTDQRPQR